MEGVRERERERKHKRRGGEKDRHDTHSLYPGGYYGRREEGQLAFIARTNGALISELFTVLDRSPNSKLAFAGAVSKNKFKTLEDVYFLKQDQKHNIRSPKIRKFKNFYTLKSHAEITEDFNLLQLVNVRDKSQ